MDSSNLTDTAEDLFGLGVFAVVSMALLKGARNVSKKINKDNNIEWF